MSEINKIETAGSTTEAKRIQVKVKRRELADYLIKIHNSDGVITGGELTSVWSKETYEFKDINDMLRLIEKQCNAVSYPQPQRKMNNWPK
jgi:hypothetical protein